MLALGTVAPAFDLPDPDGRQHTLPDSAAAYLVMFICNHCPFVIHVREQLAQLGAEYADRGVAIFAINSNDTDRYPADSPEKMKLEARKAGYTFPYLYDQQQSAARAYQAACTPDFFVFDNHRRLVYRGQLDDSRPGNDVPVSGHDLRAALNSVLTGAPLVIKQKPSIGCSIKWRPGNEPSW
jgi:thiol-disulfide isomerase/thioredoxin